MTAQIMDAITYKNDSEYCIIANDNNFMPFNPNDYNIKTFAPSTACWCGFHCDCEIKDDKCIINTIYVSARNEFDVNSILNGQGSYEVERITNKDFYEMIKIDDVQQPGSYVFKNLNKLYSYSGKLLIGKDFLNRYYIHMGTQMPHAFKTLYELEFKNGILIKETNMSIYGEIVRSGKVKIEEEPSMDDIEAADNWIEKMFSQDYNDKVKYLYKAAEEYKETLS